jgi:dienelactone hydrolase
VPAIVRRCAFAVAAVLAGLAAVSTPRPIDADSIHGITQVPCPQQDWQFGDAAFEPLPGAKAYFGRYDGGLYRIEVPDNWNGELVLWAHGYFAATGQRGSALRLDNHPIREHLIREGYAWAASSYRCNGYVPGQGLLDTLALTDLFTKTSGSGVPRRTYLTGQSMGGHITILAMHKYPTTFAGGLAMCAAGPGLFDFYAGVAAAAEAITDIRFTPDAIPQDLEKMTASLGHPPDYTVKGRQLASVEIDISGGPRPFATEGLASEGRFLALIAAGAPAIAGNTAPLYRAAETTQIRYALDEGLGLTPASLERSVRRKSGDPAYRGEHAKYEELAPFDGGIERPLMTLHGTGDLWVPVSLEQTLKGAVTKAGHQPLLTQRVMRIAGHCGFSQPEQIKAFDDLVRWVRDGHRPDGDDVDGSMADAGRRFTDPLRENDPGGLRIAVPTKHQ